MSGETRKKAASAAEAGTCDVCGSATLERHCKVVCPMCGYTRDCSDP